MAAGFCKRQGRFWTALLSYLLATLYAGRIQASGRLPGFGLPKGWDLSGRTFQQKIVALVDSECPPIDYELERKCSDLDELSGNKKCLKLPFAEQPRLQDRKHAMQRTTYMSVFRRIEPGLSKMGFQIGTKAVGEFLGSHRSMAAAEILIVSDYTLAEVAFHAELSHVRFIVVQTMDSATVPRLACDFGDSRILAYFQHTSLYPLAENNGPLIDDERLYAWLDPMNTTIQMRKPALNQDVMSKVHTVMPYIYRYKYPLDCGGRKWYLKIRDAFEKRRDSWLLPLEARKWDIVVVAPPNPMYPESINEHRLMALEMVRYLEQRHQLKVKTYLLQPATREFYDVTQNAKIFVSPFGLGEAVGKDYETILSGAVLVKPYSVRLKSSPDIYTSGYSVSCRADFADLEQVVMTILGHLKRAQSLVDTAYSKLVKESADEQMTYTIANALKWALDSPAAKQRKDGKFCKPGLISTDGGVPGLTDASTRG